MNVKMIIAIFPGIGGLSPMPPDTNSFIKAASLAQNTIEFVIRLELHHSIFPEYSLAGIDSKS